MCSSVITAVLLVRDIVAQIIICYPWCSVRVEISNYSRISDLGSRDSCDLPESSRSVLLVGQWKSIGETSIQEANQENMSRGKGLCGLENHFLGKSYCASKTVANHYHTV